MCHTSKGETINFDTYLMYDISYIYRQFNYYFRIFNCIDIC